MNSAISGEFPEEPVVSTKSGLLFEKRLIERHISDNGKCPITSESLTIDDIVPIKTGKIIKPKKPLLIASIPELLGNFQNEWEGLMLSNFALEQQLHPVRQELSLALYQHDSACRVIARLKKERDEARHLLADVAAPQAVTANGKRAACDEEPGPDDAKKLCPGISTEIITEPVPDDAKKGFTQLSSQPLHKTNKPEICSMEIQLPKTYLATSYEVEPKISLEDLIEAYLRPKVLREPTANPGFIIELGEELYTREPWLHPQIQHPILNPNEWFYFGFRPKRKHQHFVMEGVYSVGMWEPLDYGMSYIYSMETPKEIIGSTIRFRYWFRLKEDKDTPMEMSNWFMREYSFYNKVDRNSNYRQVLCKINHNLVY